jgi:thioredoxin 1
MLKTFFLLSALLISGLAQADYHQPYSAAGLEKLQTDGATVLVDFHAPWCPTCRAQDKSLSELSTAGELKGIQVVRVDYDKEKELKKSLGVTKQSTLILFKGKKEIARVRGDSKVDALRAFIAKAKSE